LQVREDDVAVHVKIDRAENDLDLYVRQGKPCEDTDSFSDADFKSESYGYDEEVLMDRDGDTPLVTGTYFVQVVPGDAEVRRGGRRAERIGGEISVETFGSADLGNLPAGTSTSGALDEEHAFRGVYRLRGFDARRPLRIDLVAPGQDADLWVAAKRPARSPADADVVTEYTHGAQTLVFVPWRDLRPPGADSTGAPAAGPGDSSAVYVTVASPNVSDADPVPFEIFATAGEDPPPGLARRPLEWPAPQPNDVLGNAVLATVEIHAGDASCGSGILVSPTGYVLTNQHVVEGPLGRPWDPAHISVGMTTDTSRPAQELFRAEVVASDVVKDLALLRVSEGLYGNPLPAGKPFPYLRHGGGAMPALGDELTVLGFPGTGGDATRPTISLSRGVVSGFVRRGALTQIKTDAEISSGNSGGPVLDARGLVIGVASAVIEESGGSGRLGYVVPWSDVPEAWKERIDAALPRLSASRTSRHFSADHVADQAQRQPR
jgi:S1-C subfamily serine protease